MKKTSLAFLAILTAVVMLLSGCIFPYWWHDGGHGHGHGGRGGGHSDGGGRGGGGGGGRH